MCFTVVSQGRGRGGKLAYFRAIVLDGDLLVSINVLSVNEIFESAFDVNQEFLVLLIVFVCQDPESEGTGDYSLGGQGLTVAGTTSRIVPPGDVERGLAGRLDVLRSNGQHSLRRPDRGQPTDETALLRAPNNWRLTASSS